MSKPYPPELSELADAAIKAAPLLPASKSFLQAVDWSRLSAPKIAELFEALDGAKRKPPPWLLGDLIRAGHSVDDNRLERLPLPARLLNRLNAEEITPKEMDSLKITSRDVAGREIDDGALALALVKGLKAAALPDEALQLALTNWRKTPQLVRQVHEQLARAELAAVKLRLLSWSTTQPFAEDLAPAFAAQGFDADVTQANFGEVIPELLKPAEENYDAYILLFDLEGFHPHDWRLDSEANINMLKDRLETLASALASFAENTGRPLFINTLPPAPAPALGFIDRRHTDGTTANIKQINRSLSQLAAEHSQIILIDSFIAMASLPPVQWSDPKLWFYGRIPYAPEASRALAADFARAWRADKKGPAKVLAIDLDNTMWGGVFGEDGVHGLQVGDDFPGNAFKAMQNEFLRLKNQGMLLPILSKNDPAAISVFGDHPGMKLKEDDFVGHRINWTPKPQNIRDLAAELNVGLDSFIFLDDSPHEREAMRALAPEVFTPELPDDPAQRPSWLRTLSNTWPLRLTAEDAKRSSMYLADQKARQLKTSAASFEDYLAGLEQKLLIEEVSETTLPRVAQMHIRTNQFNLTTRRYDESDIRAMMEDRKGHLVVLGRASDKFGDHGVVICATVAIDAEQADLKTLLMSCRVIGREVETAFLGALLQRLQSMGVSEVKASYIPTVKNVIVKDFYKQHGFAEAEIIGDETVWLWRSEESDIPSSIYVTSQWADEENS